MLAALDMQLEQVRTVLSNTVCEVNVYTDVSDGAGALYTVVSLHEAALGKQMAGRIAVEGLFAACADFVGSFSHRGGLNLVFRYTHERRITSSQQIYSADFPARKALAVSFLSALAESGIEGDVGCLLVSDENVNISGGRVYLNYFLDFSALPESGGEQQFYNNAALYAFTILSWGYAQRYDGNVDQYPNELRLLQKKAMSGNFRSFSQLIAFIRELPDAPREQRRGITRIFDVIDAVKAYVSANGSKVFMAVIVAATLIYLVYQVGIRIRASVQQSQNSVFVGMETIGEVYLGEEYY